MRFTILAARHNINIIRVLSRKIVIICLMIITLNVQECECFNNSRHTRRTTTNGSIKQYMSSNAIKNDLKKWNYHHQNRLSNVVIRRGPLTTTRLRSQSNNNGISSINTDKKPSLLFSSEIVSIILGIFGLVIIVFHRLESVSSVAIDDYDLLAMNTRNDLIAAFAAGGVLFNGVSELDITSVTSSSVMLQGTQLKDNKAVLVQCEECNNAWVLEGVLQATPAKCAVLLGYRSTEQKWSVVGYSGYEPRSDATDLFSSVQNTPILNRFLALGYDRESYLPTLQTLPGRIEFAYLPPNTQEVLLLPGGVYAVDDGENDDRLVLVLGGDTAKSFSPKDIAWCRAVASKLVF